MMNASLWMTPLASGVWRFGAGAAPSNATRTASQPRRCHCYCHSSPSPSAPPPLSSYCSVKEYVCCCGPSGVGRHRPLGTTPPPPRGTVRAAAFPALKYEKFVLTTIAMWLGDVTRWIDS